MVNLNKDIIKERELLQALCAGDKKAYETIYYLYSRQIFVNILKMVKSQDMAQELLQIVFIKVWEKREFIDPFQSFKAYLFQIAKYAVYNFFRKNNIEQTVHQYLIAHAPIPKNDVEERIDFKESEKSLMELISKLPPKRQKIFTLCKIDGRSYKEVSELMGISISTINDHIVKATKFIKQQQGSASIILLLALMRALTKNI